MVSALVVLGPPKAPNDWHARVDLLSKAFKRHRVPNLQGGSGCYTVQWVARTLLHAQLVSCGATLDTSEAKVEDLPGPDEKGYLTTIAKAFGVRTAAALFKELGHAGPAHLFSMELCLIGGRHGLQV